jgi:diguanylate cyclase (GGDEF)-like protein/PAS domain S-box-containing protein
MLTMNLASPQPPLNILVIDDDDVDREKILRLLRHIPLNLNISEGSSTAEALQLIHNNSFQCAILDYQLRGALGMELVEALQGHSATPIPIIMVSGNSDERIVANVMREGIFDYLPKRNLSAEHLYRALENGLEWAQSESVTQEQHSRFNELAEGLPQLVWTCLPDGRCDFLNRRWCDYTGQPQEQQLDYGWLEYVHPEDQQALVEAWATSVKTGDELHINFRIRRKDGEYRWFDTRATAQRNSQGDVLRWLGSNTDITEFELTRQALTNSEQRFHAAFDYAPLGMALINLNGEILQVNSALQQLLGHGASRTENNELPTHILQISHPEDIESESKKLLDLQRQDIPFVQFEKQLVTKDERLVSTQVSVALINKSTRPPCYLYQFYDLSERKRHEEQLIKLAHYDSLTGLGNRAKLHEEIEFLIQKSQRISSPFAVLFGDLDHFKQINDGLGHEAGDLLLRTVARRLSKCLRRGDSVARLGGDEFVILLKDVNKFEAVVTVADKLIKRIKRPVRLGTQIVHVSISFGIALYPTDGDNAQTLLRNADSALYDAKAKGRGCHQLYRKELTDYVHNRLMLDADMRNAIAKNEFKLYYQPVFNLHNRKIESAEALIRWQHPLRGLVTPDEFIPYAQENGLINLIGEWVINEACRKAAEWRMQGFEIPVAVNISARQFYQNHLIEVVKQALEKNQLPAANLILEITEQMFLENTQDNIRQINELKALGTRISLDDFGTGYSSLGYIIRFAPHYLKIDRSFIEKIGTANEHDAMVNAIIGLNKIMPMTIVAEGVETAEQENFLQERGCDLVQGYLYAHPSPDSDMVALFNAWGIVNVTYH